MKRIGLLFGSFNPLHNGHILVAKEAQAAEHLDDVWFVVQPQNPYKPSFELIDYETRVKLIQESGLQTFVPRSTNYQHYMLETLQELAGYELTLILGEDLATSFNAWEDFEAISQLAKIYVSHRIEGISSGQVRDRLNNLQSVSDLLPRPVNDYLIQRRHSNSDSPRS